VAKVQDFSRGDHQEQDPGHQRAQATRHRGKRSLLIEFERNRLGVNVNAL